MSSGTETTEKEFLAETEVMDLAPLRGKTYGVAVATGGPNAVRYLATTLHGPYDFVEMVQEVGDMWVREQHHAKVIVMEKDVKAKVRVLDTNTVDYLEAHFSDIIFDETLADALTDDKQYTCTAGIVEEPEEQPAPAAAP